MLAYCVAANCNNSQMTPGITMHELPRNRPAWKWIKFIQFKRAGFLAAPHHAHLCSEHFSECDFANPMEYRMGFASKLTRCSGTLSKSCLTVGSGSLSSPMREHRNFAQFYCISVTNFSTVSECILLEIIWIKRMFSSHSYGCFYVCMQCTSKNRQLIFYGRYLPFVRCRSRGPRHERKRSMCLSARWKSDTRCTQQYVVSLDRKLNADSSGVNAVVVYKHLWSLERILVRNSQKNLSRKMPSNVKNIPPQNEAEFVPFRMRYGANGLLTGRSFTSQ